MNSESPLIARLIPEGKPVTHLRRATREAVERLRTAGCTVAPSPYCWGVRAKALIEHRDRFGLPTQPAFHGQVTGS